MRVAGEIGGDCATVTGKSRKLDTPDVFGNEIGVKRQRFKKQRKGNGRKAQGQGQPRALVSEPSYSLAFFVLSSSPTDSGYFLDVMNPG